MAKQAIVTKEWWSHLRLKTANCEIHVKWFHLNIGNLESANKRWTIFQIRSIVWKLRFWSKWNWLWQVSHREKQNPNFISKGLKIWLWKKVFISRKSKKIRSIKNFTIWKRSIHSHLSWHLKKSMSFA